MSDDGLRMRYIVKLTHWFRERGIERNKEDEDGGIALVLVLVIDEECTHHRILNNSLKTDGADESDDTKGGDEHT